MLRPFVVLHGKREAQVLELHVVRGPGIRTDERDAPFHFEYWRVETFRGRDRIDAAHRWISDRYQAGPT